MATLHPARREAAAGPDEDWGVGNDGGSGSGRRDSAGTQGGESEEEERNSVHDGVAARQSPELPGEGSRQQ
jgi:hypothetical protein